jgi:putative peptidoglycan lipid II flippase
MRFTTRHIGLTGFWVLQGIVSFAAQAVIAAHFGTSVELDSYLVGVTLPTTIYMVVSTALGQAAIVYFNQVKVREGDTAAFQSISGLLILVVGAGIIMWLLLFTGADRLVTWLAPGLVDNAKGEAIRCLQLTSLSLPFLMMYSLLIGLLNAQHMFFRTTLASIILVGLVPLPLLLGSQKTAGALAWGFNAGAFGACLLLFLVGLYERQLRKIRIWWSDLRHALSISLAPLGAAACAQALWLAERYFASSLDPGTISALNYGQRIVNFIVGGLTFATSALILPYLSAWVEAGERDQAANFNRKAMAGTTVCAVAGLILILGAGDWLVRLAYARGQFDASAIASTTTAVSLYVGVFVACLYGAIITPNAMAMNEKQLILLTSAVPLLSYLTLTSVLIHAFGYKGLPLSASIAFMLGLTWAVAGMWKKHSDFYWKPAGQTISRSVASNSKPL